MLIDWFTVGAQALNFLILVWLMKRYLYQPILDAIDARESRIAAELADAHTMKAEAGKERAEFEHRNERFDQERATLLIQACDEAEAQRKQLFDEARAAAGTLSAERQAALSNEARDLSQAIRHQTREEVFAIARKVLADLAAASLEERMSEVFIQRLLALDGEAKAQLAAALQTATDTVQVRSTFELPQAQREAIQQALNEISPAEIHVRFETAPHLVSGIELATTGQKLAWSIDDYLGSLEKSITALVEKRAQPSRSVRPEPPSVLKEKPSEQHA